MTDFKCPNCSAGMQITESIAGKTVACPKCNAQLRVPADFSVSAQQNVGQRRALGLVANPGARMQASGAPEESAATPVRAPSNSPAASTTSPSSLLSNKYECVLAGLLSLLLSGVLVTVWKIPDLAGEVRGYIHDRQNVQSMHDAALRLKDVGERLDALIKPKWRALVQSPPIDPTKANPFPVRGRPVHFDVDKGTIRHEMHAPAGQWTKPLSQNEDLTIFAKSNVTQFVGGHYSDGREGLKECAAYFVFYYPSLEPVGYVHVCDAPPMLDIQFLRKGDGPKVPKGNADRAFEDWYCRAFGEEWRKAQIQYGMDQPPKVETAPLNSLESMSPLGRVVSAFVRWLVWWGVAWLAIYVAFVSILEFRGRTIARRHL
ncbi:MAG: hypothetical protein WDZ48_04555 [Pirellulales bacterium]